MKDEVVKKTVDILWTGGWDSTFRVICLVESGYKVRPHYIIDPARPSSPIELKTISGITDTLNKEFENKILKLQTINLESISIPCEITDSFDEIRSKHFVGSQYKWLAAYTLLKGLDSLELSIHKDDRACDLIREFVAEDSAGTFTLCPAAPLPIRKVFRNFSYPLISMSKSDMKDALHSEISRRAMDLTWFCHTPVFGRYPCGHCNPCIYTAQEGLMERLPWHARVRYCCRVYPRLKQILIMFPRVHGVLRKMK